MKEREELSDDDAMLLKDEDETPAALETVELAADIEMSDEVLITALTVVEETPKEVSERDETPSKVDAVILLEDEDNMNEELESVALGDELWISDEL